jgi:uncharacterized protein
MLLCRWCLCASRWKEALEAGTQYVPPVYLEGCHERVLEFVTMDELKRFALQGDEAWEGGSEQEAALHTEL